jgi:tRNA(fMet)-specific endonuclease VapC
MSFLLDTDICSAHLKANPKVYNRFLQYLGRLHISSVTLAELHTWASRANKSLQRLQGLLDLLHDVQGLPVDEAVAKMFGDIRAPLLDAGTGAPPMDLLIAATALVHQLALVTHNLPDFANVPRLSLVDWLSP